MESPFYGKPQTTDNRPPTTAANALDSHPMREPESPPMGCLDAIEVGARKLTIQTEFFARPHWRAETKVYLGGELKKVYTAEYDPSQEAELQKLVNEFHQAKVGEITAGLRARQPQ